MKEVHVLLKPAAEVVVFFHFDVHDVLADKIVPFAEGG